MLTVKELQKEVMIKSRKWWRIHGLHDTMVNECYEHRLQMCNESTLERNIRHFREYKYGVNVLKRKVAHKTFEYKLEKRGE